MPSCFFIEEQRTTGGGKENEGLHVLERVLKKIIKQEEVTEILTLRDVQMDDPMTID